jgi:hypothetical protein
MRISGHRTASVFSRYNIVNLDNLRAAALKIAAGAVETDKDADNPPGNLPKAEGTIQ